MDEGKKTFGDLDTLGGVAGGVAGGAAWQAAEGQTIGELETRGEEGVVLAGRYWVVRRLGEGGMGSVWLAEDAKLDGRKVAVKMLPAILAGKKGAYKQVKAEAMVAMKLSHPNIATVRAFEEDEGGNPFLVMDYIEGEGLDDMLAEKGALGEEETRRVLGPVAAALDYAHSQGVVHRDVKPGNVMVAKDGTPYVLDFGIAREVQETMTRVTGKLSSGTLLYMSPEQLNGERPRASQDVYSFAAMAYECLAGEPPFCRGAIEDQIKNKAPEALPGSVGKALRAGVMAGLAKEAEGRPGSCAGVLGGKVEGQRSNVEGHRSKVEGQTSKVEGQRLEGGGRGRWRWMLAALLAVGVGVEVWTWQGRESGGPPAGGQGIAGGPPAPPEETRTEAAVSEEERARAEEEARRLEEEAAQAAERKAADEKRPAEQKAAEEAAARLEEELGWAERRAEEADRRAQAAEAAGKQAEEEAEKRIRAWEEQLAKLAQEPKRSSSVSPSGTGMAQKRRTRASATPAAETKVVDLGGGVTLEMVACPGGLWMGKTEVTQGQWERVMGENPSHFKNKPENPVECVSWTDCQEFVGKLNATAGARASGLTFRLPTEEEWETACRAGAPKSEPYCKLADGTQITADNLSRVAYFGHKWLGRPSSVGGGREPNAWKLYDMHGNVWEWTSTAVGVGRVLRGGSFNGTAGDCAAGNRNWIFTACAYRYLGLRLAATGRAAAE